MLRDPQRGNDDEHEIRALRRSSRCACDSALAANEFYVVQDTVTKKCSIVELKPTLATMTLVGKTVYKTQAEAESGMKAEKVCATN